MTGSWWRRALSCLLATAILAIAAGAPARAEGPDAPAGSTVVGTVIGEGGVGLDRVLVHLRRLPTPAEFWAWGETDSLGRYSFTGLAPGTYELSFHPWSYNDAHGLPPGGAYPFTQWTDIDGQSGFVVDEGGTVTRDITLIKEHKVLTVVSLPSVRGVLRYGETLTAEPAVLDPAPESVTYKWLRNGKDVPFTNYPTYWVSAYDMDARISVQITAHRGGYLPAVVTSPETVPIPRMLITSVPTPTISGVGLVGETLEAVPGQWPEGISLSFRWRPDGADLPGDDVVEQRYVVRAGDKGRTLTVEVHGELPGYRGEGRISAGLYIPRSLANAVPSISGSAAVGATLRAVARGATKGAAVSYTWFADGRAIPGARGSTYTLTASQRGRRITVRTTVSHVGYTPVSRTSGATAKVALAGTPRVLGTPVPGSVLTAAKGVWTPLTSYAYQWLRNGAAIPGATRSTYRVSSGDVGKQLAVKVTGRRTGYATVARTSAAVTVRLPALASSAPSIAGRAEAGSAVTAIPGSWASGATLAYQWQAGGVPIEGATGASYVVTYREGGKALTVAVTGSKPGYAATTRTSAATPPVPVVPDSMGSLQPVYRVGVDVVPGVYRSGDGAECHWERRTGDPASGDQLILASGPGEAGQLTVELALGEYFHTTGCGDWSLVA